MTLAKLSSFSWDGTTLPLDLYLHLESIKLGLNIQSWGSWFSDWVKALAIEMIIGTILLTLLMAIVRASPRRWWFYSWLISIPVVLALTFLQPLIVDPLFHTFMPLQSKDPTLTQKLEEMLRKAHVEIPPERIYWTNAGDKVSTINAYVTGIGASKRIVVWDTALGKLSTDQVVFVVGHETGHYVLHHIWKSLSFALVLILVLLYSGFYSIDALLRRFAQGWGVRDVRDWAAAPALLLLLTFFATISTPLASAFSRNQESEADRFGLELTHGLTADSAQTAAQAFQALGENSLSEVNPPAWFVWFFYSHPPIHERIKTALSPAVSSN